MINHNRKRYNPYAHYTQEEQNIINVYLCSTSMNIYRQWIADKKALPINKLIEFSGNLLSNGINSLIQKS